MNLHRVWWTGLVLLMVTVAGCDGGGDLPEPTDPTGPSPEPPEPPPPPPDGFALNITGGGHNVSERFTSDLWVHGGYAYTGTWGGFEREGNPGERAEDLGARRHRRAGAGRLAGPVGRRHGERRGGERRRLGAAAQHRAGPACRALPLRPERPREADAAGQRARGRGSPHGDVRRDRGPALRVHREESGGLRGIRGLRRSPSSTSPIPPPSSSPRACPYRPHTGSTTPTCAMAWRSSSPGMRG